MSRTTEYILSFLLYHNKELLPLVGYTSDTTTYSHYKVVIVPSGFFNDEVYQTEDSIPSFPLQTLEGIPILFGQDRIVQMGSTLVVYADLIASSYFLLSRYEEFIYPSSFRDVHGRFMGSQSLANRSEFIDRPIIDEYGFLLLKLLKLAGASVPPIVPGIEKITLTHDVDTISHYRRLRGALGGVKRSFGHTTESIIGLFRSWFSLTNDPAYTFPWLLEQDARVKNSHSILFLKSMVHAERYDYPRYSLYNRDFKQLRALCNNYRCELGLHASYASGNEPDLIKKEVTHLTQALGQTVDKVRYHYLHTLQPSDMLALADAGLTDDYSMGYADVAGFRFGSCRPVHFIDPKSKEVTPLVMHPLTAMDSTLFRKEYMNMTDNEAYNYVRQLIDQTKKYRGEVVLLWHNTTVQTNDPQNKRQLYQELVDYLSQ